METTETAEGYRQALADRAAEFNELPDDRFDQAEDEALPLVA